MTALPALADQLRAFGFDEESAIGHIGARDADDLLANTARHAMLAPHVEPTSLDPVAILTRLFVLNGHKHRHQSPVRAVRAGQRGAERDPGQLRGG